MKMNENYRSSLEQCNCSFVYILQMIQQMIDYSDFVNNKKLLKYTCILIPTGHSSLSAIIMVIVKCDCTLIMNIIKSFITCINPIVSCVYTVLSCVDPILSFENPILSFQVL